MDKQRGRQWIKTAKEKLREDVRHLPEPAQRKRAVQTPLRDGTPQLDAVRPRSEDVSRYLAEARASRHLAAEYARTATAEDLTFMRELANAFGEADESGTKRLVFW